MSKVTFSNISMHSNDINRMTSDDYGFEVFYGDGNIEYYGQVVGSYKPEKNKVSIRGKRDKTNPLVLWLAQNSFLNSDTSYKVLYP